MSAGLIKAALYADPCARRWTACFRKWDEERILCPHKTTYVYFVRCTRKNVIADFCALSYTALIRKRSLKRDNEADSEVSAQRTSRGIIVKIFDSLWSSMKIHSKSSSCILHRAIEIKLSTFARSVTLIPIPVCRIHVSRFVQLNIENVSFLHRLFTN